MNTMPLALRQLESENLEILREAVAGARLPVMMYSVGKDSSVMQRLVHTNQEGYF